MGALIMSFFGAVFASLTLYWQWHLNGAALALPLLGFVLIGLAASYVIRSPGEGIKPSPKEERAIMWSSIGEGVCLFLASAGKFIELPPQTFSNSAPPRGLPLR
jgi:hypothetical protein